MKTTNVVWKSCWTGLAMAFTGILAWREFDRRGWFVDDRPGAIAGAVISVGAVMLATWAIIALGTTIATRNRREEA